MMKPAAKDHIFIRNLTEITLANLGNENFGAKELAKESGLSSSALNRRLQSKVNKTINQFIRELRLQKALEMLREEQITVSEAAFRVGFSSPAYFTSCFHEFFGFPPGKARDKDIMSAGSPIQIRTVREKNRITWKRIIFTISGIVVLAAFIFLLFSFFQKKSTAIEGLQLKKTVKSIAVLPFKNLSDSLTNQYFIDGLMEEILTDLSRIHELRVISRTSVEQYRDHAGTTPEIGKELDVEYIVEGSAQKYGNRFRLRVQLIETARDRHVWAASYEKEILNTNDIFDIQNEIAGSIADQLKAKITPEEKVLIEQTPTRNLTAYDFYQRGMDQLSAIPYKKFDLETINKAAALFHRALAYDSTFARAYIGLAWTILKKYENNFYSVNYLDSVWILSNIALHYDNSSSDAYYNRGYYYSSKNDKKQAAREFEKAISLNPNSFYAYQGLGYCADNLVDCLDNLQKASFLGHDTELPMKLYEIGNVYYLAGFPEIGLSYCRKALELEGDSIAFTDNLENMNVWIRRDFKKAIEYYESRLFHDPGNSAILNALGFYNLFLGRYKAALEYYTKYLSQLSEGRKSLQIDDIRQSNQYQDIYIGYAYLLNGYISEADNCFDRRIESINKTLKSFPRPDDRYSLACIYACRGDKTRAFENLRIFITNLNSDLKTITLLNYDPFFSKLRNEPEFRKILLDLENKYTAEHEKVKNWLEEHGENF